MILYPNLISDALRTVVYAGTKKNLIDSGMVGDDIVVDGMTTRFTLIFPRNTDPFLKSTVKAAEAAIHYHISPDVQVTIELEYKSKPRPEVGKLLPDVKNIIAVSSGKGGVGKSTVAVNLAIAMARMGYKVGLLDADIFGPSVPKMMGVEDEKIYSINKDGRDLILPLERYGVKMLSIGFFVAPQTYAEKDVRKRWKDDTTHVLNQLALLLEQLPDFSAHAAEPAVMRWIADNGYHLGNVMNALRLTLVGQCRGPHIFDITELLGRDETLRRLRRGITTIKPIAADA